MVVYPDRRNKKDPLLKYLAIANAVAAIGLFVAICITAVAKPEVETFFDRFYKVNVYRRPHWDMVLVDYIAIMLAFSGITSIIGLLINSRRLKRKGDYIRATLVICLVMSVAGLGLYFGYG
jgi:hypothetical protein